MIAIGPHHRAPVPGAPLEGDVEHPQDRAKGADLGRCRHERGDRRGRALVDVRRPGLERDCPDLEQQPHRQHGDAEEQQDIALAGQLRRVGDRTDVDAAGVAVEQRDAVDEEGGGERAEQEVLDRCLLRQQAATAGEPGHQVEREAQDLERHEHEQQVVGGGEEHHPAEREHREREDLGLHRRALRERDVGARARGQRGLRHHRAARVVERALGEHQDADGADDGQRPLQEQGRTVDRDGRLGHELRAAGEQHDGEQRGDEATQRCADLQQPALRCRGERFDQHAEHGCAEHDEQRAQRGVLQVRGLDVGGHGPTASPSRSAGWGPGPARPRRTWWR